MGQQRNDERKPNPGGQGGAKKDDMQRSPGVDQGGQRGGQKMDRPDDDTDRGTGRSGGRRDDQE